MNEDVLQRSRSTRSLLSEEKKMWIDHVSNEFVGFAVQAEDEIHR